MSDYHQYNPSVDPSFLHNINRRTVVLSCDPDSGVRTIRKAPPEPKRRGYWLEDHEMALDLGGIQDRLALRQWFGARPEFRPYVGLVEQFYAKEDAWVPPMESANTDPMERYYMPGVGFSWDGEV